MDRLVRLTLFLAACLVGVTAIAQSILIEKDYPFGLVNGKVLPIPPDLPGGCQGGTLVTGWPEIGLAPSGGIYLPPQPSLVGTAVISLFGADTLVQNAISPYCLQTGLAFWVNYYICSGTPACQRPKLKFHIRTKSAVIGVRG